MVDVLLRVQGLYCQRDGRELFGGLDFQMSAGQCIALTGPNGSGKSTLLRCISGFFPDYQGEIEAAGVAYLGHRPGVSLSLSPLENLRWYAGLYSESRRNARAQEQGYAGVDLPVLLDRVGLAGYEELLCQGLSAGQQRRVALARLMMDSSRLWLLDEPFTALDAEGQDQVRSIISAHMEAGGAALCATHQDLQVPGSIGLSLGARAGRE